MVSQWATEPYMSNAVALLVLAADLWSNTLAPVPGGWMTGAGADRERGLPWAPGRRGAVRCIFLVCT